jgi:hypothetical protein
VIDFRSLDPELAKGRDPYPSGALLNCVRRTGSDQREKNKFKSAESQMLSRTRRSAPPTDSGPVGPSRS